MKRWIIVCALCAYALLIASALLSFGAKHDPIVYRYQWPGIWGAVDRKFTDI